MIQKLLIITGCCLSLNLVGVEADVQFENDRVRVMKIVIGPHEEIGLHRDEYPQVVISLNGGTITRLEADGSKNDVEFLKGQAVFREADPAGQMHRSVNNSCDPVDLFLIQLKK